MSQDRITIVFRGGKRYDLPDAALERSPTLHATFTGQTDLSIPVDRDAEGFDGVAEYLRTGVLPKSGTTTDAFTEQAYYWQIMGPALLTSWAHPSGIDREALHYDIRLFVEKLLYSLETRDPICEVLMRCERYHHDDRWSTVADARKYVEVFPDMTRTIAYTDYGVVLTFKAPQGKDDTMMESTIMAKTCYFRAHGGDIPGILTSTLGLTPGDEGQVLCYDSSAVNESICLTPFPTSSEFKGLQVQISNRPSVNKINASLHGNEKLRVLGLSIIVWQFENLEEVNTWQQAMMNIDTEQICYDSCTHGLSDFEDMRDRLLSESQYVAETKPDCHFTAAALVKADTTCVAFWGSEEENEAVSRVVTITVDVRHIALRKDPCLD